MHRLLKLVSLPMPRKVRYVLLRLAGVKTQAWNIDRCVITGNRLSIGPSTFINRGCLLDPSSRIDIGARCAIGMEVMIATSTHDLGGPERRAGELRFEPVRIGDGCWIGARAMILPGVSIGDGCVVAAGAVVTGDLEAHRLYAGVPAREVRAL